MKHKIINKTLTRDIDKESLLTSIEQLSQVMDVMTKVIARVKYQVEQLESTPQTTSHDDSTPAKTTRTEKTPPVKTKEPLVH